MINLRQPYINRVYSPIRPTYCLCPYCNEQLMFFYLSPLICNYCTHRLEVKYLDLPKSIEYRLEYYFSEEVVI